ncbi:MAG: YccF domain-containing protein [Butyricimonas paravirosa]
MKILGNIIWVLFGGFFIALEYLSLASAVHHDHRIPFGIQTLKLECWPSGLSVAKW